MLLSSKMIIFDGKRIFFHTSMNFPLVRRCTGMLLSSKTIVYLARKKHTTIAVTFDKGILSNDTWREVFLFHKGKHALLR
jgi:hypothetical protein